MGYGAEIGDAARGGYQVMSLLSHSICVSDDDQAVLKKKFLWVAC